MAAIAMLVVLSLATLIAVVEPPSPAEAGRVLLSTTESSNYSTRGVAINFTVPGPRIALEVINASISLKFEPSVLRCIGNFSSQPEGSYAQCEVAIYPSSQPSENFSDVQWNDNSTSFHLLLPPGEFEVFVFAVIVTGLGTSNLPFTASILVVSQGSVPSS